jgi:hypothetical protein
MRPAALRQTPICQRFPCGPGRPDIWPGWPINRNLLREPVVGCGLRIMSIRGCHAAQTTQERDISRRDAKTQRRREGQEKRTGNIEQRSFPLCVSASLRLCVSARASSNSLLREPFLAASQRVSRSLRGRTPVADPSDPRCRVPLPTRGAKPRDQAATDGSFTRRLQHSPLTWWRIDIAWRR